MSSYFISIYAYFIAAIPFGLIIAAIAGKQDPRKAGSGNIGATNMMRTAGKTLGLLTFLADFAKGALPVLYARSVAHDQPMIIIATAAACVIGHIFPIYLKFRGGKGIATGIGVYWALNPILGLGITITWLLAFWAMRVSAVGGLAAFILAPLYAYLLGLTDVAVYAIGVAALILWTHRTNIRLLL